ncbi:MAG TPA: glycosyltransferase [Burkholderiaceae bacterium]|nr:glycosyltransferase [Burkholderiaceae bacterium]
MSPSDERVSIIVPAFNAAAWITHTLQSLQAQTHTDWEALVADDASNDDTAEIVRSFGMRDARVRHLRLPINCGGPAGPRNFALAQTENSWVAFCDADDLWHPQKLELQLRAAQAASADLVCTAIRDFTPPRAPTADRTIDLAAPLPVVRIGLWRMLGKNVIPGSSVLCRRSAIEQAGRFDTARDLIAVEDYDLWLRLIERGAKVVKIELPLVHYRRLPSSLSARKWRMARRALRALRRHFARRGRNWLFPLVAPALMASYALQAAYLRLWRGRL